MLKKTMKKFAAPKTAKVAKASAAPTVQAQAKAPAAETKKTAKAPKAKQPAKEKKVSAVDAAAQVLAGSKEPLNAKQMIEAMSKQGLWTSPGGATPAATLYASILRDLRNGKNARFKNFDRGQFALATRKRTTTQR